MRDAVSGCEVSNQLFSFRVDVRSIENELRRGGFGESGYEVVELVGLEIEKPEDDPYRQKCDCACVRVDGMDELFREILQYAEDNDRDDWVRKLTPIIGS